MLQQSITSSGATPPPAAAQARTGLIVTMWALTFLSYIGYLGGGSLGAFLLDIIAIIIAFSLVAGVAKADKDNGRAKLWLELIAFINGFQSAQH